MSTSLGLLEGRGLGAHTLVVHVMKIPIQIVPDDPFEQGVDEGRPLAGSALREQIATLRADPLLAPTLGQTDEAQIKRLVRQRLETPPDDGQFPELAVLFPEAVERVRGKAQGAGAALDDAALQDYLAYRRHQLFWWAQYQAPPPEDAPLTEGCTGVIVAAGDGEIYLGKNLDSVPGFTQSPAARTHVVKKPRSGYTQFPLISEAGIAHSGGASVSTWLDEPMEDVWPFTKAFPVERFASTVDELADLYRRYTLYIPGRGSNAFVDRHGNMISVDKSYRRVGISRWMGGAAWHTEGYFHSPEMSAFLAERRRTFAERFGITPGSYHNQYYADCAVRFTNLARRTISRLRWSAGRSTTRPARVTSATPRRKSIVASKPIRRSSTWSRRRARVERRTFSWFANLLAARPTSAAAGAAASGTP
jgi:hypothetical protein